jgi:hypothetical protein
MRASGLLGLVLVTLACRAERARRAWGGGGGGDDRHAAPDSAIVAALTGAWRIVSLAFTQERPGDSLPKDF